jgi:cytochrome c-type biogenesis protein
MEIPMPTFPVAFLAGVLSFLSPCVLPLVPTYLAYVGGSAGAKRALVPQRGGSLLREYQTVLTTVGGVLVIGFGLVMLGAIRLPILYRDTRRQVGQTTDTQRPWGATLLGMAFAFGWTPCIGPVLGTILAAAGAAGTLTSGVGLLAAYAAGLAVPFLLAALALEPFLRVSKRLGPWLPWIERAPARSCCWWASSWSPGSSPP